MKEPRLVNEGAVVFSDNTMGYRRPDGSIDQGQDGMPLMRGEYEAPAVTLERQLGFPKGTCSKQWNMPEGYTYETAQEAMKKDLFLSLQADSLHETHGPAITQELLDAQGRVGQYYGQIAQANPDFQPQLLGGVEPMAHAVHGAISQFNLDDINYFCNTTEAERSIPEYQNELNEIATRGNAYVGWKPSRETLNTISRELDNKEWGKEYGNSDEENNEPLSGQGNGGAGDEPTPDDSTSSSTGVSAEHVQMYGSGSGRREVDDPTSEAVEDNPALPKTGYSRNYGDLKTGMTSDTKNASGAENNLPKEANAGNFSRLKSLSSSETGNSSGSSPLAGPCATTAAAAAPANPVAPPPMMAPM